MEIEAKVALTKKGIDTMHVLSLLKKTSIFQREVDKYDTYFALPNSNKEIFRIRKDNNIFSVNEKKQVFINGIEHNEEIEFEVSSGEKFMAFAKKIGFVPFFNKIKKGYVFTKEESTLELMQVIMKRSNQEYDLGWFLEIEIVSDSLTPDNAPQKIKEIFSIFGCTPKDFETQKYMDIARSQGMKL